MKAEMSESFKHKLDLNAGLKIGSFLTVKTPLLNYDNHPLTLFKEIMHFFSEEYNPWTKREVSEC